jgi:hypothetical protein
MLTHDGRMFEFFSQERSVISLIIIPSAPAGRTCRNRKYKAKNVYFLSPWYNEFGRLFKGHKGGIKGTNTCFFIKHSDVPQGAHTDICQICLCMKATQTRPI